MRTPEEIAALDAAAASWVGTPFCEHSAVKGAGVCCHRLVAEVLFEAGWLPRVIIPLGTPGWSRFQDRSLIEGWFSGPGRRFFRDLDLSTVTEPGDVLGFRIGRCVHHMAMVMAPGAKRVLHVLEGAGTCILDAPPPSLAKRLQRIWRPI